MTKINKQEIMELLEKAEYTNIEVQEYYTGRDRDSYFNKNSNLYEEMTNNIDDLEFHEDNVAIIRNGYNYNEESTIEEIFDIIDKYDITDVEGVEKLTPEEIGELEEMTLPRLEELDKNIYDNLIKFLDELEEGDMDCCICDYNILFDCDYPEEVIDNNTYEALAYWTVYFEPGFEDVEVAQEVGLTPFTYNGTFYLALGGCGMDLSPKLDAYIALTSGSIPSDSGFFNDKNYLEYVVGKGTMKKIEERCKREQKKYIISFEA